MASSHACFLPLYCTLIVVILASCYNGMKVHVYTQERRIDTFIYATDLLPALDALSVCFWLFGVPDDDNRKNDAFFSIATAVGELEVAQTMKGKIALFNMWNYKLNYNQLNDVNCLTLGNLLNMNDMSIRGPANFGYEEVPCKQVERPEIDKSPGLMFNKVNGVKLECCVISYITSITSIHDCLVGCATDPNCFSVNYHKKSGFCELIGYNGGESGLTADVNFSYYYLDQQKIVYN